MYVEKRVQRYGEILTFSNTLRTAFLFLPALCDSVLRLADSILSKLKSGMIFL